MNEVARPMPRPTAQVARYVEVLGVDLAMQFILQFGGAELYLPKEPRGKSEAEKLLGYDKLKALAARQGLESRTVPRAVRWLAEMLHLQGYSNAAIARTLRVSQVTVRTYLAPKHAPAQHSLQGQARRTHSLLTEACTALEALMNALSIGLQTPVKEDVKAAHRRAHRLGRPAKIEADAELKAFVAARLDTLTFDQIATEVAAHFTPARRVSRSSIHRWWLKHR